MISIDSGNEFSNMYPSPLTVPVMDDTGIRYDVTFRCVESALQAYRAFSGLGREKRHPKNEIAQFRDFANLDGPEAESKGNSLACQEYEWNGRKLDLMRYLISLKFRNPDLRKKLLATNDELLIHDSAKDEKNDLGCILMKERALLLSRDTSDKAPEIRETPEQTVFKSEKENGKPDTGVAPDEGVLITIKAGSSLTCSEGGYDSIEDMVFEIEGKTYTVNGDEPDSWYGGSLKINGTEFDENGPYFKDLFYGAFRFLRDVIEKADKDHAESRKIGYSKSKDDDAYHPHYCHSDAPSSKYWTYEVEEDVHWELGSEELESFRKYFEIPFETALKRLEHNNRPDEKEQKSHTKPKQSRPPSLFER